MTKAVVLLSGGLDSATCMGIAAACGYELTALSVDYGQRHAVELQAARRVAAHYGAEHLVLPAPAFRFAGGSALTDDAQDVPKGRSEAEMGAGIPATYVPGRNLVFLSQAVSLAEARGAAHVYCGVNALDYSGYPDCRPEFVEALQRAVDLGLRGRVRIQAPLVHLSKESIVRLGSRLAVPYELTHSCYDPVGDLACGECDSCKLRRAGFAAAGVVDPTRYARDQEFLDAWDRAAAGRIAP